MSMTIASIVSDRSEYLASTDFGVTKQVEAKTYNILEVFTPASSSDLFPEGVMIPMSPDDAKRMNGRILPAFMGYLQAPGIIHDHERVEPTLDNPADLEFKIMGISAVIQCGLFLDPNNKVLAVFEPNPSVSQKMGRP